MLQTWALILAQRAKISLERDISKVIGPINLNKGTDLRSIARAQTLTILRELDQDGVRKAYVLDFLRDAGLINRTPPVVSQAAPVVSLAGADLREASLPGANLVLSQPAREPCSRPFSGTTP